MSDLGIMRKKGQLLLLSAIIVLTCGSYLFLQSSSPRDEADSEESQECLSYLNRLKRYCHTTLVEPKTMMITPEGHLVHSHTDYKSYDLVHVHVVMRHGDRTPATALPKIGHPVMHYQCGLTGEVHTSLQTARKVIHWDGLDDFPLQALTSSVNNAKLSLHPGSEMESCRVGDLTSQGYLQHLNLGNYLQTVYGKLFAGMDMSSDIYVQSTDYRRTIRSAGAFLLGFIPNIQRLRETINIHVQPGSLNQEPPLDIPLTYSPCKTLVQIMDSERGRRGYYTAEKQLRWMYKEVVDFFGLTLSPKTPWTELFDKFATRGCHSLNSYSLLPCREDGSCIDCDMGQKLFDYADWSMTEKYPKNASLVAVTPFLKHSLQDTMERIISRESPRYKIMLTFTHDSTLNQLLKALGLPLKEWMPYASRLSFELWRAAGHRDAEDRVTYFVRVLFNGEVVTPKLSFSEGGDSELVDYRKWQSSVVPLSLQTYNKLCGI